MSSLNVFSTSSNFFPILLGVPQSCPNIAQCPLTFS
jgi:hypothetical protein